jgi:RNA polymerase sigma-70 factor (ECF subfamily)
METIRASGMERDPDAVLVAATRTGDARAFEELVVRHKRKVLVLAQRITNNREDAEDVVQESFHKAFLHLGAFQEKSRFATWLTRIALNESYAVLRRRRGAHEVLPMNSDDGTQPILEAFVDRNPNPEESCWRRERRELLTKAINRLAPVMRRTILLRDIEEHSVAETARILDASAAAVKSRVSRGRRELSGTVNRQLLYASPA